MLDRESTRITKALDDDVLIKFIAKSIARNSAVNIDALFDRRLRNTLPSQTATADTFSPSFDPSVKIFL